MHVLLIVVLGTSFTNPYKWLIFSIGTSFNNRYKQIVRRVWRYQRGNQNPYIEEEHTTQWPKETVQKDKQRSTKHTYKTKDRVTRTPLKTGCELRCFGRVSSSCSTRSTRRVDIVTNPVWMRKGPGSVYDTPINRWTPITFLKHFTAGCVLCLGLNFEKLVQILLT
jgi:hypothetical protein